MKAVAKVVILVSTALLLAGCSAAAFPEFATEQTARDEVSGEAAEGDIDTATTRYVGEVEGTELYIARGEEDGIVCVVQIREDEWESTGCGAGDGVGVQLESGTLIEVGSFTFPDAQVADGERTKLSDSVSVVVKS